MKTWRVNLLVSVLVMAAAIVASAQKPANEPVPKYDKSIEAIFRGTVDAVTDRQCPVSGGMGSHLILKLADGSTLEVHLSLTRFVKQYDLIFHKVMCSK